MKITGSKRLEQLGSAIFSEVSEWKEQARTRLAEAVRRIGQFFQKNVLN